MFRTILTVALALVLSSVVFSAESNLGKLYQTNTTNALEQVQVVARDGQSINQTPQQQVSIRDCAPGEPALMASNWGGSQETGMTCRGRDGRVVVWPFARLPQLAFLGFVQERGPENVTWGLATQGRLVRFMDIGRQGIADPVGPGSEWAVPYADSFRLASHGEFLMATQGQPLRRLQFFWPFLATLPASEQPKAPFSCTNFSASSQGDIFCVDVGSGQVWQTPFKNFEGGLRPDRARVVYQEERVVRVAVDGDKLYILVAAQMDCPQPPTGSCGPVQCLVAKPGRLLTAVIAPNGAVSPVSELATGFDVSFSGVGGLVARNGRVFFIANIKDPSFPDISGQGVMEYKATTNKVSVFLPPHQAGAPSNFLGGLSFYDVFPSPPPFPGPPPASTTSAP